MRISVVSDLHLEQGYQELPGGEILILSGDIAEAGFVSKHHHSTKLLSDRPNHAFRCSEFFFHECKKYEHYHSKFQETYGILKRIIPNNVTLLENEIVDHGGIMFMGATLWTDLNNNDPITEMTLKQGMNDYRCITWADKENNRYHKLFPGKTYNQHKKTLAYFAEMLTTYSNRRFVVMTHHAPSRQSINEKYKHDYLMNGGYCSDLDQFILDHPNIVLWTHGHMHDPVDYYVGSTRVVANPRGYQGIEDTSQFRPDFTIEL